MIAAILRAQLRSMRLIAHRGAVFSFLTGLIWYGFWCFLAFSVHVLAADAGLPELRTWLPAGLLGVCLYWQVVPILSASMGSALDMRKLMIYPAPHRKLFAVEVLLRLATAMEMLLVLAGGVTGLLQNPAGGGWVAAFRLLPLILFYVLFNLLLASGLRSLLDRLLSRRRLREVLIFILLIGLTAPRLLFVSGVEMDGLRRFASLIESPWLPWGAIGRAALGGAALLALAVVCGWTLAAGWFGRAQFESNLRFDAVAAQSTPSSAEPRRADSWSERFFRFPSLVWRDPLAGIVEKELRSLARTPRFRMVFVMGFSFGVMVWLPLVLGHGAERNGALEQNFLVVVSVYALTLLGQVSYWNCFGFDRSAVQFYFAAPQPIVQTLLGKNLASLIFIYLEVLILIVITMALRVGIGLREMVEALLVVGVCSLYMMAFGNISSVQYPRALTPERVSQGGASSRFQALIFILYPVALLPVFLAYLARYAFNSETAFAVILALAAAIGAVIYWLGMESALKGIAARRERILSDLSRGEGPVASS
jgi:ABC-2 type transport system permease protein